MQYPHEMMQLSRLSYYGNGISKGLQIPQWDYQSVGNHNTPARLFLQKSPRDVFTVELKREMVENDRRLKTTMQTHRESMSKKRKNLEQAMRRNTKPFVCFRGNILSRYGQTFNNLPSSLRSRNEKPSMSSQNDVDVAPMTIVNAETVLSEQYVVCERCKKTYKESRNSADSCRYHLGPVIGVFGGMCQSCGRLDYTKGCFNGFHTRKRKEGGNRAKVGK